MLQGTCLLLFLGYLLTDLDPGSYERIRLGMTKKEVIGVLGFRPQYGPGELHEPVLFGTVDSMQTAAEGYAWLGTTYKIFVTFDSTGRADGKTQMPRSSKGLFGKDVWTPEIIQRIKLMRRGDTP